MIGSLVVGVVWLLGATMALGIKINFVNFIAFPITFGIGVDYAVNVMARYLRDGERDVAGAMRGTGGAVGPLLADDHRRLLVAAGGPERRACSSSACSPCWASSPA